MCIIHQTYSIQVSVVSRYAAQCHFLSFTVKINEKEIIKERNEQMLTVSGSLQNEFFACQCPRVTKVCDKKCHISQH